MMLPDFIAGRLNPESKGQGTTTKYKISFEGSICHFEYTVSFGPDKTTPVYRHIYCADLREFDPKNIEFRRTSSGSVLVLWTRFLRNTVKYETWSREKGQVRDETTDSLFIPLKAALKPAEKRELKQMASSFMTVARGTMACLLRASVFKPLSLQ